MVVRRDLEFDSGGVRCAGWHFVAEGGDGGPARPCVVLAHGFGGTRAMRLAAFAERFAEAGLHALAFDYRGFGDSQGQPRQCISIEGQLADYEAAVEFARGLTGVDPDRMALWGSSFSGGHVVVAAARDPAVAAVVSQCGMYDGLVSFLMGLRNARPAHAVELVRRAARDRRARLRGQTRCTAPIVAPGGGLAMLAGPDAYDGVMAMAPPDFVNEVCAEIAFDLTWYRPVLRASRVRCPVLVQIMDQETTVPISAAVRTAARVRGSVQVERYPMGHFDAYVGDGFERTAADQTEFLCRRLRR